MTASGWVTVALFAVLALVVVHQAFRSKRWAAAAEKLAMQSDIELPPALVGRVARRLRTEYLLSIPLLIAISVLYHAMFGPLLDAEHPHRRTAAYVATMLSLPLAVIVVSAVAAVPAWNTPRERRVAHLVRPAPGQMFTRRAWWAIGAGLAVTAGAGAWGFWRVDAGPWWLAWPPSLAASGAAWWLAVRAILERPSHAGDSTELGWDDVLRYRQARGLTIGAVWLPAGTAFLIDMTLGDPGSLSLVPLYAVIAVSVVLAKVFAEGRRNWRQSWS